MLVHKTALLARTCPAVGRVRLDSAADKPPGDGLARRPAPRRPIPDGRAVLPPHTGPVSYTESPGRKVHRPPGDGLARMSVPRCATPGGRAVPLPRPCSAHNRESPGHKASWRPRDGLARRPAPRCGRRAGKVVLPLHSVPGHTDSMLPSAARKQEPDAV